MKKIRPNAPRCVRTYYCPCVGGGRTGVPIVFSAKLNKPIVPRVPLCRGCGQPMRRAENVYQALLEPTWDTPIMHQRVRATYSAMVGQT